MNFRIEILRIRDSQSSHGLHTFMHCATSLDMMRETMRMVQMSTQWPAEANGYRILTEEGKELYRWPDQQG